MAKNGLFSQFVGSYVRQMGRESAHTAYGDLTGKNTITSKGHVDGYKPFPGAWDYVKLILALVLLPIIGPIWAIIKGCIRAFGKKILFYEVADQHVYKMDLRYSDGKRYVGTQKAKQKVEGLKSDVPAKDVKRFNTHAHIYILLAIVALVGQGIWYQNYQEELAQNEALYQTYSNWHTVTVKDDFTEKSTSYDMVYSTADGKTDSHIVLAKMEGKYLLMSQWGSDINYDFVEKAASIEVKTNGSVKTVKLKRLHDSYESEEYMTPENKKIRFSEVLVFPKGIVPTNGIMQIRLKEKVYSFNLDSE